MKSVAIFAAAFGMLASCDFQAGPHMYVHGAARAGSAAGSTVITGVTSSDITATLAIVQRFAVAHGFHRDARWHQPELLVAYLGEFRADGSTPGCFVYHRGQQGVLEVWLSEWGRFHPSDVVVATDAELFTALQARFGGARVTRHAKA